MYQGLTYSECTRALTFEIFFPRLPLPQSVGKYKRWGYIGGGAVLGGLVFAVSGGLAVPAVVAGMVQKIKILKNDALKNEERIAKVIA